MIITYRFKLRNGSKKLSVLAAKVNYIWNYLNKTKSEAYYKNNHELDIYSMIDMTIGAYNILNINKYTIKEVCLKHDEYCKKQKKLKLNWRSISGSRKSLGWIPFNEKSIKVKDNEIVFEKNKIRFFKSREIEGKIIGGYFIQDICNDWYVIFRCDKMDKQKTPNNLAVGVDLGLKHLITTSDGEKFDNPKYTKKYSDMISILKKANKTKLLLKLKRKIRESRNDNLHKITKHITSIYSTIYLGDLKLEKNPVINDAAFGTIKRFLKYKSISNGGKVVLINEAYTTKTCSNCLAITGPKGQLGLAVREWSCEACGQTHDRDINAAKNILRIGHDTLTKKNEPRASFSEGGFAINDEEDAKLLNKYLPNPEKDILKSVTISIRVSNDEAEYIRKIAKSKFLRVSAYLREVIVNSLKE